MGQAGGPWGKGPGWGMGAAQGGARGARGRSTACFNFRAQFHTVARYKTTGSGIDEIFFSGLNCGLSGRS